MESEQRVGPPGDRATVDDLFAGDDPTSAAHRATDWAATALGPVQTWPPELCAAVRTVLPSRIPMLLWWGTELVQIFNHAYTPVLGDKYPAAIGQPGARCWAEVWAELGPLTDQVLAGHGATYAENQLLLLDRHGYLEETYWTFSYSPVLAGHGRIPGIFVATTDVTARVLGDRRLETLRELGSVSIAAADTTRDAVRAAAQVLNGSPADLPAAMIYLRPGESMPGGDGRPTELVQDDGDGPTEPLPGGNPSPPDADALILAASVGVADDPAAVGSGWLARIGEVARTGQPARVRDVAVPGDPRAEAGAVVGAPVDEVLVLPLLATGQDRPVGVLVAGISPFRKLDEAYHGFLDLVASRVSTALGDVLAYEAQRRRAAALAELDAAKTEFFTDVSHELRTPLTLIAGPVRESLADRREPLPPGQRERLELVHRNTGRLRKLVNDMLDFARIEGGRLDPERVETDLPALTAGVAESFAYAMRQAGLTYQVDVRALPHTAYVDRDMWEKVVVNLLSNALKYTLTGTVRLRLRGDGEHVTLSVDDTGVGIPADQQPLMFRRFHRVRGAGGRSHEGTGIGLALVQEMVRLHGGSVGMRSVEGEGSTFTVRLPYGRATTGATAPRERTHEPVHEAYIAEALRWLPGAVPAHPDRTDDEPRDAATVLVVDDNADLRGFLASLLAPHHRVVTAVDGREALDRIAERVPDLVLTDVMMPRLDGFGLVRALRADRRTAGLPIIVLSARAGEEAAVEGLRTGADDYLAKPFSSEELLARVGAHLELARLRNEEATWRAALVESLQDAFAVVDADGALVEANEAFCRLVGTARLAAPVAPPHPWWPEADAAPADRRLLIDVLRTARDSDRGRVTLPLRHADGHRVWAEAVYNSLREPRTGRRLYVATLRDVTDEVRASARQSALAALSGRLGRASDVAEVLDAGLSELCTLLDGTRGLAVCADAAGTPLVVTQGLTLTGRVQRALDGLAAEGEPRLVLDDAGRVTAVGARIEPGGPPGGVWLELDPPRSVPTVDQPLVRQLCVALAQALVRARAFETQRTVALAMQRAMLGPVDLPAGFATRYQPAVAPLEVGGDWYDVVQLPGDLVGVVVGDVVGRGLPAATVMGQLRSASRALLLQAKSPAEVLSALDDFARMVPGGACTTVFCAIIDRSLGMLRYSSAGHPPGILVHPDGSADLLTRAGSVPLASVAVPGRPEAGARLRPGSTLLLYTDGLIERRRELIDAGISRAVAALTQGRELPEGALADRVVRDLLPDTRNDDVAVLVYRHREPAVFAAALTADPGQLAPTREALRQWLAGLGIGEVDVDAVLIATGEACANAIEHGYRLAPDASVTVRGRLRADRLEVVVSDTGGWREATPDDSERGRGRLIMARLMDEATVDGNADGTTVRLAKRVSGA
ncbi:SpoIIE family protein phosphatase [Micromonospora peucetia]|uniref:SpoIIE family protein phosphatase n=1 Tax=Micromonospora peucetia TaxID=47871 RepID=UPI0022521C37|nr:SpoIIE family protein phosphatase [Micromonospora peucetia]MCX4390636.1 SpoIIE family protein phosphatase [Micromonospora peucetia]